MQRNGQKRDKKIEGEKRQNVFFPQVFWQKVFDMDFTQKLFSGVFELPRLRNAQKCHTRMSKIN
jgi:hypothetical protein